MTPETKDLIAAVINCVAKGYTVPQDDIAALIEVIRDADMAQAALVERAEAECRLIADRFRSQMAGTTLADASYRLAEAEVADKCAAAIRALAPDAGVKDLAALRAERVKALREGYLAGFKASGEGWNGEYPFEGEDPEKDAHWIEKRDRALKEVLG